MSLVSAGGVSVMKVLGVRGGLRGGILSLALSSTAAFDTSAELMEAVEPFLSCVLIESWGGTLLERAVVL